MRAVISLLAIVFALSVTPSRADEYRLGSLQIVDPWSRATPKGAAVAAGYMKIINAGAAPDRLIGGSSESAGRFELHEMSMEAGVMRMRPLPSGIEIKPGESVELRPGSLHIMFLDLKKPVQKGEPVTGTLVFQKAGAIEIKYSVVGIGETPAGSTRAPQHGGH